MIYALTVLALAQSYLRAPDAAQKSGVAAQESCRPLDGAEVLFSADSRHFIVVGEVHGTEETPQIFGDLVCQAAKARRHVAVALEYPAEDQPILDEYLASDGSEEAQKKLLASQVWSGIGDGRGSASALKLFDRLRQYKKKGMIDKVVYIVPRAAGSAPRHEELMAGYVRQAPATGETILTLVGNLHARLTPLPIGPVPYKAMAAYLPSSDTVTLNVVGNGGYAWICYGLPGKGGECGAHALPPHVPLKRGITLGGDDSHQYSGILALGTATTASPPAMSGPAPITPDYDNSSRPAPAVAPTGVH